MHAPEPRSTHGSFADLPPPPSSLRILSGAFMLSPAESRLLWLLAAPALHMKALRTYRRRWPKGPWPDVRVACRLACDAGPFEGARLFDQLGRSPLLRFGLLQRRTVGDRHTARVAPDVLRTLDRRAPLLPEDLRSHACILPLGQAWRSVDQARLTAALAGIQTTPDRWLCIDADPDAGTLDAIASLQPTLCVDPPLDDALDLLTALRIARTRRLQLLIRTTRATWPAVLRWATDSPGGFVVERPPGLDDPPDNVTRLVAQPLSVEERRAIWAGEVDSALATWLARRHVIGQALIQRCVDALRLHDTPLTRRALDAEVRRRRRGSLSHGAMGDLMDFPTTFR